MKNISLIIISLMMLLSGCTAIQVSKIDSQYGDMNHVCIEKNEKVIVGDFLGVVQDGLNKHGVSSEIYLGSKMPKHCVYKMTYTALKTWDLGTYLHHAEIRLFKDDKRIGFAEYHLNGKGGLALNKWASVKSKMDPVIDELFSGVTINPNAEKSVVVQMHKAGALSATDQDIYSKLSALKKMRKEDVITEEEYVSKKKELLNKL